MSGLWGHAQRRFPLTKSCPTLCNLPCPSLSPTLCSNSCPLNQLHHPTILSSVAPCFSCLQSFPASGSNLMSQLFPSGIGKYRRFSFSISPSSEYAGLIPLGLWSKGLSRVVSSTTVRKNCKVVKLSDLVQKLLKS